MLSDSQPHPSNSGPKYLRHSQHQPFPRHPPNDPAASDSTPEIAISSEGETTTPAAEPRVGDERHGRYNPRVIATLCYAIPFVVSVVALIRERRNRFVRFHAAQSIIFFVAIFMIQLILFAALIVVGNSVGTGAWSVVLGILFIGGFLALGIGALLFWLRLLADCWAGRATAFPVIGALAHRMERLLTRAQRGIAISRPLRQNDQTP